MVIKFWLTKVINLGFDKMSIWMNKKGGREGGREGGFEIKNSPFVKIE